MTTRATTRQECSLQPDAGEATSTGMRQEVDIRYVVTSLEGTPQHLYENVYCQRGQRTAAPSRRIFNRYPSCLISCTQSSPAGGLVARVGIRGGVKPEARSVQPRHGGPRPIRDGRFAAETRSRPHTLANARSDPRFRGRATMNFLAIPARRSSPTARSSSLPASNRSRRSPPRPSSRPNSKPPACGFGISSSSA